MPILNINNENKSFLTEELGFIFGVSPERAKEMKLNYLKLERDFLDVDIETYEEWLEKTESELERSCIFYLIENISEKLNIINKQIKNIIDETALGKYSNYGQDYEIITKANLADILEFEFGYKRMKEDSKYFWFKSPFLHGENPHLKVDKIGKFANTALDERTGQFLNVWILFELFSSYSFKEIINICKKYQ